MLSRAYREDRVSKCNGWDRCNTLEGYLADGKNRDGLNPKANIQKRAL